MTSITIGTNITDIGSAAFEHCYSLTNVTLPDNLVIIPVHAFYLCTALKTVTIPKGVTNVGGAAFYGCSGLTRVYFKGDAPNPDYGNAFSFATTCQERKVGTRPLATLQPLCGIRRSLRPTTSLGS